MKTETIVLHSTTLGADSIGRMSEQLRRTLVVVCANNEAQTLGALLRAISGLNVLVVNDGSTDDTSTVASSSGATLLNHVRRMGKPTSLQEGICYASEHGFEYVIVCDADTIPVTESVGALIQHVEDDGIGAAVARQIPLGSRNVAFFVDELIWAVLEEGRRVQLTLEGSCHLGGVFYALKVREVSPGGRCINDDEDIGLRLKSNGLRTVCTSESVAYFDASSCVGHIFERRKRMNMGHLLYSVSTAPSMNLRVMAIGLMRALKVRPRRLLWTLPAVAIEVAAKLAAWHDVRVPEKASAQRKWVTTYQKRGVLTSRPAKIGQGRGAIG